MKTQFIFFSCDQWKTHSSRSVKFTFQDSNANKILKFLEVNMDDYFDGSPQRKKDSYNAIHHMVKHEGVPISKSINTSQFIYATCEEVDSIIHLQY